MTLSPFYGKKTVSIHQQSHFKQEIRNFTAFYIFELSTHTDQPIDCIDIHFLCMVKRLEINRATQDYEFTVTLFFQINTKLTLDYFINLV